MCAPPDARERRVGRLSARRLRVPPARADARVGDGVYVTGTIGGAWDAATGLGRHLDFTPRIAAAHALAAALGDRLGAMIDVSDGLGRDLGHIASQSKVAMELELASVPCAAGIAPREAIGQGEDYELAFTARGGVPREAAGVRVTRIGTVVVGAGEVRVRDGTEWFKVDALGFEHEGGAESGGAA
jgi:thiamine-monophosphate kinase